jgi:hypothetical protein
MPERVTGHPLRQSGATRRFRHRPLNRRFVEMKPRRRAESRIATNPPGWKHELPPPLGFGVWRLARQRGRQRHAPIAPSQIGRVPRAHNARWSSRCARTASGSMTRRSFCPLPRRTVISRRSKSRSFTRSSRHSCNLSPAPYNNDATSHGPAISPSVHARLRRDPSAARLDTETARH